MKLNALLGLAVICAAFMTGGSHVYAQNQETLYCQGLGACNSNSYGRDQYNDGYDDGRQGRPRQHSSPFGGYRERGINAY